MYGILILCRPGKKQLGFANPWLYASASGAMHDIVAGASHGCGLSGHGWPAVAGWDAVTGLGTPNFPALVAAALNP